MGRRARRWMGAAVAAVVTVAVVWVPMTAHAGITLNAID
jgi:hypothetical protein